MFNFLKRKIAKEANAKYIHTMREYGKGPSEFLVFSSMDDEKIQKKEHVWVSWQVVMSLLENSANLAEYATSLEKALETYSDEKVKEMLGGLK